MFIIRKLFEWLVVGAAMNFALYLIVLANCVPGASIAATPAPPVDPSADAVFLGVSLGWWLVLGAIAGIVILAGFILSQIMKIQSVAEGAILEMWDRAQKHKRGSYRRLWMEKRIMKMAKRRLNTRKRSARGVVNEIMGVVPKKRAVKRTALPAAANGNLYRPEEWRRAA